MPPVRPGPRAGCSPTEAKPHAGPAASQEAIDTLVLLAASCESSGHPLQAIHCLATLLAHGRFTRVQEARARCAMGRLMLQHMKNPQAAHKELLAAQALAKDLLGAVSLQCEIACQLARYYQSQGEVAYQVQLYDQALRLCSVGSAASEGPILHRWAPLLHLLKAQALATDADITRAVQIIHAGAAYCEQHMEAHGHLVIDIAIHMQLFLMQLQMVAESQEGYLEAQGEAHRLLALLPAVRAAAGNAPAVIPAGFEPAVRLQLRLLQALYLVDSGRMDELMQWGLQFSPMKGGEAAVPQGNPSRELEELAAQCVGQDAGFEWLPMPLVSSLISLISALLMLFRKIKSAVEMADKGLQALEPVLHDMGLATNTACESTLDAVSLLECRPPLALCVQLMLVKAGALMGCGELQAAQPVMAHAMDLATRFPHQLRPMMFPLHLVAAQYCYDTGEYAAAVTHLQAVKQHSTPGRRMHLLASSLLAITVLAHSGGADNARAVEAAIDALGSEQYSQQQQDATACRLEVVVSQLAVVLIKLKLEQTQDARLLLSQTLKMAHSHLNHYALVSHIMLLMIPLQAAVNDMPGAQSAAQSGAMLSRFYPAIEARVYRTWSALHGQQGAAGAKEAHKLAGRAAEKAQAVAGQVQAARQQPVHAGLLSWGLQHA